MTLIKGKFCQSLLLFCILLVPGSTYDPEFDVPLPNLTAKQGTEVSFTCVVKHLGEYKVAWIKADDKVILAYHTNKVSHNPRYHVTHNGHNTWTLIIKNVQQNDSGSYMCQVNTLPMTAQLGTLEVVVPADIIDEETSNDVIVSEGQSAVLRCKATGYPSPKVRWKRQDGQPLPLSRELLTPGEKLSDWEGETLPLRPLGKSDNGAFLCIASNNIPPQVSKRVMVYVHFSPLIKVSNQLVAAPAEINVTLECDVESVPKPFISWNTKEGKLIMNTLRKYAVTSETVNEYTLRVKLTIYNLQPEDFTDYNCSARNTLGENSGLVKLQRIYPPPAPRTTIPTTTPHHPVKHPQSKDHERDGNKHTKTHRRKPSGGRGHVRTHNNNFNPYDDLNYDDFENGEPLQVTTMVSNFNPNNNVLLKSHHNKGDESTKTTAPPWGSNNKNIWGGSGNKPNSGLPSYKLTSLPGLIGFLQLIPCLLCSVLLP